VSTRLSERRSNQIAVTSIIVFNILIPCTENATGFVHPPSKFDEWVIETADRFGGITEAEFVWDPAHDPARAS
jgi:hypothetical protein